MAMLNNQRVSENGVPLIPTAWWWTNPPEKYMSESQLGWFSIPNQMESQSKFHGSKPPTRICVFI